MRSSVRWLMPGLASIISRFVTVPGLRSVEHELAQSPIRGRNVFDPVRRARALDLGDLDQGGKGIGTRLGERRYLAPELANVAQRRDNFGDHQLRQRAPAIELRHEYLRHTSSLCRRYFTTVEDSLKQKTNHECYAASPPSIRGPGCFSPRVNIVAKSLVMGWRARRCEDRVLVSLAARGAGKMVDQ